MLFHSEHSNNEILLKFQVDQQTKCLLLEIEKLWSKIPNINNTSEFKSDSVCGLCDQEFGRKFVYITSTWQLESRTQVK